MYIYAMKFTAEDAPFLVKNLLK